MYLPLVCNTVFPYNVVFLHILSRENSPVRSRISLKRDFLKNFEERKFSFGFSFEATGLDLHATPILFEL